MADPNLSKLLNWSLRNTTASDPSQINSSEPSSPSDSHGTRDIKPLDPDLMKHLFGGPSDADLMKSCMASILDVSNPMADRVVAFENLEQLIEGIDNANNIKPLGLWPALIGLLSGPRPSESRPASETQSTSETQPASEPQQDSKQLQIMAAWTIGTAVQNNISAQVSAYEHGAIEPLVQLTRNEKTRRKAVYALSSEVRNYQVGLDRLLEVLGEKGGLQADDMQGIDELMERLRGTGV